MVMPQHKNPCPGVLKYFVRPFLGHHYYILGMCDLCLGVEQKIFKEIMHFHDMTNMATPQHKNPCPGALKCTILVDSSFVIITTYSVCLIYAQQERRNFKDIMHFHQLTYVAWPQHINACPEGHFFIYFLVIITIQ